jgi:hypothetical protein
MELSQELLQQTFSYEDGNLVWKKQIGKRSFIGKIAGSNVHGYYRIGLLNKEYLTHRLIFMFHHGYLPKEVDHIDGNKLNNRIENLRPASHSENLNNQKLRVDSISGHKNVGWASREQKWRVRVTKNGKQKHIGYFIDRDLAELVAVEATNKLHQEFSAYKGVLNGK